MTEQRTSQQKARLEEKLQKDKGTKQHKVGVKYTRTDTDTPTKGEALKWASNWTPEEAELLKALQPGDEFVVNKTERKYTTSEGEERTTWELSSIADVSTYKPKPAKPKWNNNKGNYTPNKSNGYDNLGQQVGNCVTNAIASLGPGKDIDQYKTRMLELAEAGNWLRERLETKPTNNTAPPITNTTQSNKSEMMLKDFLEERALRTAFDELDDIEF